MKKLCSLILSLLCLQMTAQELPTVTVVYSGTTATVDIPTTITGVIASVNGAKVSITSTTTSTEYRYLVSGTTSDGNLTIIGKYNLTLELAGLNLTSKSGAAINVDCGKRTAVILTPGKSNTLIDGATGSQKAALYFKGHPEFEGGGTLSVTGNFKHAISAKEYIEIKKTTGSINVYGAKSDGIHCGVGSPGQPDKNYFKMSGGTVNIMGVQGDCIDSDDYGTVKITGGLLQYTVSKAGAKGIKCDSVFTMTGGEIQATLTAGNTIDIAKADTSRCMAINVGQDMNMTGGRISIERRHPESKSLKVKGTMSVTEDAIIEAKGSQYTVNPANYQYSMSVYAAVDIDGAALSDYANYQIGAFCGDECRGSAVIATEKNTTYAYLRVYSNTVSDEAITFKVYDSSETKEWRAEESLTFESDNTVGRASSPFNLSVTTTIPGDVNGDGIVTIADLALLIDYLNGGSPSSFNPKAADANGDGQITLEDVRCIEGVIGK